MGGGGSLGGEVATSMTGPGSHVGGEGSLGGEAFTSVTRL